MATGGEEKIHIVDSGEENTDTKSADAEDANLRPSKRETNEQLYGRKGKQTTRPPTPPPGPPGNIKLKPGILRVPTHGIPSGQSQMTTKIQELETAMDTLLQSNTEKMSVIEQMSRRSQEQIEMLVNRMEMLRREIGQPKIDLSTDMEEVDRDSLTEEFRIDATTGAVRKTRKKRNITLGDFPPLRRNRRTGRNKRTAETESTGGASPSHSPSPVRAAGAPAAAPAAVPVAIPAVVPEPEPEEEEPGIGALIDDEEEEARHRPRGGRRGRHESEERTKPVWPVYDEKSTKIRSYSALYELQAAAAHYPKRLWKATFSSLLKSIAQKMAATFTTLNPECSYEDLRDHLISNLDRSQDRSAELRFETQERLPHEDLQVYASQLCVLGWEAYGETPGASTELINKLVLNAFHRNLKGPLGEEVRKHFSRTLEEAVALARNLEISGFSERPTPVQAVQVQAKRPPARPVQGANANRDNRNMYAQPRAQPNTYGMNQPRDNPHYGKTCYNCGKQNHIAADCRLQKGREEQARKKVPRQQWGNQNSWQNNNRYGNANTIGWQSGNNWQANGTGQKQPQQKWSTYANKGKEKERVNNVKEDEWE